MSKSAYCGYCRRKTLGVWQYPNVALHSLLLVLTCGLWFPVWFCICAFGGKYVCHHCGEKV